MTRTAENDEEVGSILVWVVSKGVVENKENTDDGDASVDVESDISIRPLAGECVLSAEGGIVAVDQPKREEGTTSGY